ncbi:MAG: (2Fe-2S)-binding protein [Polaromonas sp.]|uniref:(2Fe-2S)-binding protein n=1 Tax=Polaromonas sp. TaxID=1869339 RepID=UPI0017924803|nr:(2Fe-2S)-binding protein [Polaromonas sp.]MBA3593761.1 (2Fe-2S)-binding protein [Polaromonas sp.]
MTQPLHKIPVALFQRVAETGRPAVGFVLDGQALSALAGDTVLTAVLTHGAQLRRSEFSGAPRAGFCLMGACQDCWITTESGQRLRACGTFIEEGMRLVTGEEGHE